MRARLAALVETGRAVWREGFLSETEISDVFVCADAIVLPYRHIDQSGVLLLAVTLGVPMIVTDVGGLKAFVTPETGLIVREPTGAAVSVGVSDFLSRRAQFSKDAILRLGASYAWKNTIKPLLPRLLLHDWRK
jgi:glycosyltransferase involved in cell wall biosynthesis